VAEIVGFHDAPTAHRAVKRWFGRVPEIDPDESRAMWRERLELLWRQSLTDSTQQRPGAVRAAVAVAQRAAALDGLDAPTRVEVYNPTVAEIAEYVQNMRASLGDVPETEPEVVDAEVVPVLP
jgi:hypothetical protein